MATCSVIPSIGVRTRALSVTAICALSLLTGCEHTKLYESDSSPSREDAAAITVSATAIPWANISAAVQPNFTITGDLAVQQIAPITSRVQQQTLDALSGGLQVGLANGSTQTNSINSVASNTATLGGTTGSNVSVVPAGTSSTTTATGTNGGTVSVTTTTNSASTPVAATLPGLPSGIPAAGLPLTNPALTGDPSLDPMLKYEAALALYQEVQLMNNEVQNIAARACLVPYLAHLKIGVLPYKQRVPYDLHERVAFFASSFDPPSAKSDSARTNVSEIAPYHVTAVDNCNAKSTIQPLPEVIPILVTDDVERAVKSRSLDVARQLSLALSYMSPAGGAGANVNDLKQTLDAVLGQEIDSRLTVVRQSDNTIYARIGAAEEPTVGRSLIGQTYDISVLLLVPKVYFDTANIGDTKSAGVSVVTFAEFRDPSTGAVLPERSGPYASSSGALIEETLRDLDPTVADTWKGTADTAKYPIISEITNSIQASNYTLFASTIDKISPILKVSYRAHYPELWAHMSELLVQSAYGNTLLELSGPSDIQLPDDVSYIALSDDGTNTAALIGGTAGISPNSLQARLILTKPRSLTLFPSATTINAQTNTFSMTFPSLKASGLDTKDVEGYIEFIPKRCNDRTTLCPRLTGALGTDHSQKYVISYITAGTQKPSFKITPASKTVVEVNNTGTLVVAISGLSDPSASVSIDGPDIKTVTDNKTQTAVTVDSGKFTIKKPGGTYTIDLENLAPGGTVGITVQGLDDNGSPTVSGSASVPILKG